MFTKAVYLIKIQFKKKDYCEILQLKDDPS